MQNHSSSVNAGGDVMSPSLSSHSPNGSRIPNSVPTTPAPAPSSGREISFIDTNTGMEALRFFESEHFGPNGKWLGSSAIALLFIVGTSGYIIANAGLGTSESINELDIDERLLFVAIALVGLLISFLTKAWRPGKIFDASHENAKEVSLFAIIFSVGSLIYITKVLRNTYQVSIHNLEFLWCAVFLLRICRCFYFGYFVQVSLNLIFKFFDSHLKDTNAYKYVNDTLQKDLSKTVDENKDNWVQLFLIIYGVCWLYSHTMSHNYESEGETKSSNDDEGSELRRHVWQHIKNLMDELIVYVDDKPYWGFIAAKCLKGAIFIFTVLLNTLVSFGDFFQDFGWIVSAILYVLDRWIKSTLKKYEDTMIVGWNVFIHGDPKNVNKNGKPTILLNIINEGAIKLSEILAHDPVLYDDVIDAARAKTEKDDPFVSVKVTSDQANFMRTLVTTISQALASSNWPEVALRNVKDKKRTSEMVLLIPTCERDKIVQFTHTRAWLIFPSELEMLLDYTEEEINRNNDHPDCVFKVVVQTHRVRIINLRKWAEVVYGKSEDNKRRNKETCTSRLFVPCQSLQPTAGTLQPQAVSAPVLANDSTTVMADRLMETRISQKFEEEIAKLKSDLSMLVDLVKSIKDRPLQIHENHVSKEGGSARPQFGFGANYVGRDPGFRPLSNPVVSLFSDDSNFPREPAENDDEENVPKKCHQQTGCGQRHCHHLCHQQNHHRHHHHCGHQCHNKNMAKSECNQLGVDSQPKGFLSPNNRSVNSNRKNFAQNSRDPMSDEGSDYDRDSSSSSVAYTSMRQDPCLSAEKLKKALGVNSRRYDVEDEDE